MKWIKKDTEPESLKEHRDSPDSIEPSYKNYRDRDTLRLSLLKEQGYLCCYCLGEISKENMKIEHWKPQSKYREKELEYKNLLAACKGGEIRKERGVSRGKKERKESLHCDSRKGNMEIKIDPTDPDCEKLVEYGSEGNIFSTDQQIDEDLNKTLNLNKHQLKEQRAEALDAILKALPEKYSGPPSQIELEAEIKRMGERKKDGTYREYCMYIIDGLTKILERRSKADLLTPK